jgi:hypothetical protein
MKTCSLNKKTFSKLVASSLLFASASWLHAAELQGFFSAGGGVTFDTPKFPRKENLLADPTGLNANLNKLSEYHKVVSPTIEELSSRFNAHRDNKIGLQFYQTLDDDISITTQLIAQGYGSNFDFNASWAFLTWQAKPNLTLRTGRLVTPIYMLSEYLEVGFAYPWVRPPLEMYSSVPLKSWSSADITYSGYRGDWDYSTSLAVGTVDQDITLAGVKTPFTTRNGLVVSAEGGNDLLRLRAGVARLDIKASLSLASVDGIVDGAGSLYSGWAVNVLNDSATGNVRAPNHTLWTDLLGGFDLNTTGGAASFDANLDFLKAATAYGLASGISAVEPYNETTNLKAQIDAANTVFTAAPGSLAFYTGVGLAAVSDPDPEGLEKRNGILGSIAGTDLAAYSSMVLGGAPANVAAGFLVSSDDFVSALNALDAGTTPLISDINNAANDPNVLENIKVRLAKAAEETDLYTQTYVGNAIQNTSDVVNFSNTLLGTLVYYDAANNPTRFNALSQLLNLSGKDLASNYGLVQQAIKSAIDETYLTELRYFLYKTYDQTFRSGTFLSAGYTYDNYDWYSIGEWAYRRLTGFLSDQESWYVTVARRYGPFMPHITYASSYTRDENVRKTSADIYAGQADANKLFTKNELNDWKKMLENVRDGASDGVNSNVGASPVDYENLLFALDQLEDFWSENQTYHQNTVTLGLRYDWKPGVCMKTEVSHYRPRKGCRGYFSEWDTESKNTGNSFKMSIDAVF